MTPQVALVKCDSYDPQLVEESLRRALGLMGSLSSFVKPKSKVLVKPNLLIGISPDRAITTHPAVIRAVVRLLKELECTVYLGDGPSAWGDQSGQIEQVYEKTGVKRIADEEDVRLVTFRKRRWRKSFPLSAWLDEVDSVVSVPKFKTHGQTTLTGAIKNLFGLVSDTYKVELHRRYLQREEFNRIVVDIYEAARPALTIIDGIDALEGDGPATSGTVRHAGVLVAGRDCVAVDSVLASIMGLAPLDIDTTAQAAGRKLGQADLSKINIVGEKLADVIGKPFLLPKSALISRIPKPVIKAAGHFIRFFPAISRVRCTRCGACAYVCPSKAITVKDDQTIINHSKCVSCFCCQETCPAGAIRTRRSLLAKMLGF